MTNYEEFVTALAEIRARDEVAADPEQTHGNEDWLMAEALRAIAAGVPDGQRIAALMAEHVDNHLSRRDVVRWYA